jgi:hypothetical protein
MVNRSHAGRRSFFMSDQLVARSPSTQNNGESDAANQIGGVKVAKEEAARSLFPGEDAQS